MESEKTQELGLNQTPINDVFKISQVPKNFKYGQKIQYAIHEKEMELYPSTGNQTYYQQKFKGKSIESLNKICIIGSII